MAKSCHGVFGGGGGEILLVCDAVGRGDGLKLSCVGGGIGQGFHKEKQTCFFTKFRHCVGSKKRTIVMCFTKCRRCVGSQKITIVMFHTIFRHCVGSKKWTIVIFHKLSPLRRFKKETYRDASHFFATA